MATLLEPLCISTVLLHMVLGTDSGMAAVADSRRLSAPTPTLSSCPTPVNQSIVQNNPELFKSRAQGPMIVVYLWH